VYAVAKMHVEFFWEQNLSARS